MELRQYLKILKKYSLLILVFAVAGLVAAFYMTTKLSAGQRATQLFYLNVPDSQNAEGFNYSGFYEQEKARNFTDTAVAILESHDFKSNVLAPRRSLEAKKVAPQLIRLNSQAPTMPEAVGTIDKAASSFNEKMYELERERTPRLESIGVNPQPQAVRINRTATILAGLLAGFIFSILTVALKEYFKV